MVKPTDAEREIAELKHRNARLQKTIKLERHRRLAAAMQRGSLCLEGLGQRLSTVYGMMVAAKDNNYSATAAEAAAADFNAKLFAQEDACYMSVLLGTTMLSTLTTPEDQQMDEKRMANTIARQLRTNSIKWNRLPKQPQHDPRPVAGLANHRPQLAESLAPKMVERRRSSCRHKNRRGHSTPDLCESPSLDAG